MNDKNPGPLQDRLSKDCEPRNDPRRIKRLLEFSQDPNLERRQINLFLGCSDHQQVERCLSNLRAKLWMEALPRFLAHSGGEIVCAARFENNEPVSPIEETVYLEGEARYFVIGGHCFAQFDQLRVVVSIEPELPGFSIIRVRSTRDPQDFFHQWETFTRVKNHLRGRTLTAIGTVIELPWSYDWHELVLPEATMEKVRRDTEEFFHSLPRLRQLGVRTGRRVLFEGPSQTGKTLAGWILSSVLPASFIWVWPYGLIEMTSFQEIIDLGRFLMPSVLFLEDIDVFASASWANSSMALDELLGQLDSAVGAQDMMVIATTNNLAAIEPALEARPGFFDRVISFGPLGDDGRRQLLRRWLRKAVIDEEDMDYLVCVTRGWPGGEIRELVETLKLIALENSTWDSVDYDPLPIGRAIIDSVVVEVPPCRQGSLPWVS